MTDLASARQPSKGTPEYHTQNGDKNDGKTQASSQRLGPEFTKSVVDATGPKASPRMRQIVGSLVQHLHAFSLENDITTDELMTGLSYLSRVGQWTDDKRNEALLAADILGLETLADDITNSLAAAADDEPTASAILGPFWRKDAPRKQMGDTIVSGIDDGDHAFIHGCVRDFRTGQPIENAELDLWHTAPNGLYEQQDENQADYNLRGRFTTGKDGTYNLYCLRPTKYPIPDDGPTGELLALLDRHPWRPAHIHFIITAPGYKSLITQIFDRGSEYVYDDAVFAVKDSLIVDFAPRKDDPKAQFELEYDFRLVKYSEHQANGTNSATK